MVTSASLPGANLNRTMRIYFCSDIHASEKCWKKFLAAPKFYNADVIIVGGDVTGKFVVPIIEGKRGKYTCRFAGVQRKLGDKAAVEQMKNLIADSGSYAWVTTPDEHAQYEGNQDAIDGLFRTLIMERVERWINLAQDKLGNPANSGVRVFVSGANDDFFEVDDALSRSDLIEDPNGKVIPLDDGFEIVGMGYGNVTPWHCPRDIEESELAERIDVAAKKVTNPARAVFSLHVPPYGSGLDHAPELDGDLRMVTNAGGANMIPVGSTAVRDAIANYRPLIGVHGHIHESRGVTDIEGVPVANPGSEYGEGVLDGLIIELDKQRGLVGTELVRG
jgi:Icc-related predicted phosphoesterase